MCFCIFIIKLLLFGAIFKGLWNISKLCIGANCSKIQFYVSESKLQKEHKYYPRDKSLKNNSISFFFAKLFNKMKNVYVSKGETVWTGCEIEIDF